MVSDAALTEASLHGDTAAFGQIVERYKALICSITYSGTGNLSLSEELAQETFLTAWRKLNTLEERGKLRAWLCGIARNLTRTRMREERREPVSVAWAIEDVPEAAASEQSPADHAISREAQELLWRALENIPDTYREPMILFYREQQSIRAVAQQLDLSEDAVKQRLSRGRAKLKSEMAVFVEDTLGRSGPAGSFTAGVLVALSAPKAAAATAAGAGIAAWFLGGILGMLSGIAGGLYGARADYQRAQSAQERRLVVVFTASFLGYIALFLLSFPILNHFIELRTPEHARLLVAWVGLGIGGLGALTGIGMSRFNRARLEAQGVDPKSRRRPLLVEQSWQTSGPTSSFRRTVLGLSLALAAGAIGVFAWIALEYSLFASATQTATMILSAVMLTFGILGAIWIAGNPRMTVQARRFFLIWMLALTLFVATHIVMRAGLPSGTWATVEENIYLIALVAFCWYAILHARKLENAGLLYTHTTSSRLSLAPPARMPRASAAAMVYGVFLGATSWLAVMTIPVRDWMATTILATAIAIVPGLALRFFTPHVWRIVLVTLSVAAILSLSILNLRWNNWMAKYRVTQFYEPLNDQSLWVMNLVLVTVYALLIVICFIKARRDRASQTSGD